MTRRVATSRQAALAFEKARQWLCQPGAGSSGLTRWNALDNARHALAAYPYIGIVNPHQPGTRLIVVAGHRIIYRIDPDTGDEATAGNIRILQVFGPGQK